MPDPDSTAAVLDSEPEALKALVAEKMGLADCDTDARAATEQDFYLCAVFLAKDNKFTLQEASAAFSVVSTALANLKTGRMALSENVVQTRKLMAEHTSEEDQYAVADELKTFKASILDFQPRSNPVVSEFLKTGLFQHYRMYTFLFHGDRPSAVAEKALRIQVPPPTQPLDEARSQRERLQIEAAATLGTVGMPPLPTSLSEEEATELTAKLVAEIASAPTAGAADAAAAEGADGGEEGAAEGEGAEGVDELNQSLTSLTTLTPEEMSKAVADAANIVAQKLLTQVEEPEEPPKKK